MPNGRYAVILMNPDLPKFKENDRLKGTFDENMAVVRGTYAHFGTFLVNDADSTFVMHIEGSTFPNDVGTAAVRRITSLSESLLTFTNDTPPTGAVGTKAFVVLQRAP
jgi:hypothetical protein